MNKNEKNLSKKLFSIRLTSFVLLIAMFIQTLAIGALADPIVNLITESAKSPSLSVNGVGKFDQDEEIQKLKQDFLSSIREDLLMRVDEYELTGDVGVILTFSDDEKDKIQENSEYHPDNLLMRNLRLLGF